MKLLKFIYRTILTGMPMMVYNPFTRHFNIPFTIKPYSSYVNFKLNRDQVKYLNEYVQNYSTDLSLAKIKLSESDEKDFYLSVNIYNCSSPLFLNNNKNVLRCEINAYVKNTNGEFGSVILDYSSNYYSLDPINLFHKPDKYLGFFLDKGVGELSCNVHNENIKFAIKYNINKSIKYDIDNRLIKFTDKIYYKNGIYDKLYYDSSLVESENWVPTEYGDFCFKYKDLEFDMGDIHSIFFFQNNIDFICSFWHNLFQRK